VEEADPETIHKIEEKLHHVEEVAQEKLHDLTKTLHLTREPNKPDPKTEAPPAAKGASSAAEK
jgi:hypothetical protein